MHNRLRTAIVALSLLFTLSSHASDIQFVDVTEQAGIPVIGIGSGAACDGQILVLYDLLGLTDPAPKHARSFMNSGHSVADAVRAYVEAVHSGSFP